MNNIMFENINIYDFYFSLIIIFSSTLFFLLLGNIRNIEKIIKFNFKYHENRSDKINQELKKYKNNISEELINIDTHIGELTNEMLNINSELEKKLMN